MGELVRLRKKELKQYRRQKVLKRKKEVWIQQEEGCVKKGSSLRLAIKESLKMKNDAEAKKNDSKLNVQSKAKSFSTNKLPKKKTANADKEKEEALKPDYGVESLKLTEKVKTLIDPQTPLVDQMKKIHAALPGMGKQTKWMMFSELSQAIPVIKRAPELEDILLTFVQFYQVPISGLGEDLRQFAEMLITDLLEAGITNSKSIEEMVIQIHQKSPSASLDDWLEEASKFNENFQSFMLAGHLDHEFYDVDVVMQVFILRNIPVILEIEQFLGAASTTTWETDQNYCAVIK